MELAEKDCAPCRGGVAPLSEEDAKGFVARTPGWELRDGGKRIERTFRFKDFAAALAFVDRLGALAEGQGHHPDVRFGWGYCTVSFNTHRIGGLHENDFIMAAKANALAP